MLSYLSRFLSHRFSTLNQFYYQGRNNLAIIFNDQNLGWTHEAIDTNAKAFAGGLKQTLGFIEGTHVGQVDDGILVRLSHEKMQEQVLVRIAADHIKAKVHISKAKNEEQLGQELKETKARTLIFDSYGKIGDTNNIDVIYRLLPEVIFSQPGREIIPRNYQFLRSLIHTDYYQFKGAFGFQNLMKFKFSTDYGFDFTGSVQPIKLDKLIRQKNPIIVTQPCDELAYRAGVLNCLVHGYLLVCALPEEVKNVSEKFNHNINVICTEEMSQLHRDNRVFLRSTCQLYQNHPQRVQIVF